MKIFRKALYLFTNLRYNMIYKRGDFVNIRNFNNGLDVDGVSDSVKENGDTSIVKDFFADVEISNFIVPYKDNPNTYPLLEIKDKGKMLPIFSSYEAFEKCPLPKESASVLPFSKLDEILKKSNGQIAGIVINPHGKSMIFQRNGYNPGETKLMKPESVPESIVSALNGYFKAAGNVYCAYLLWAQKKNDLAPHIFLIVDFDGKREEFFPKLGESLRTMLKPGERVEMAKADFKLLRAAEKLAKPIYKKA